MDFISEFLSLETMAIILVSTGVIVIVVAVAVSNKVSALSSMIDDFRNEVGNSIDRRISGISDSISTEINNVTGLMRKELSSMSDASRDSLQKTVSDINKEINDFKNEFSGAEAGRHSETQKTIAEINQGIITFTGQISKETASFAGKISKDIEAFKNEQLKTDAERHEALHKKFAEQSLHLQDRIHNVSQENVDNFNKLQERIRKTVSTGLTEAGSNITDKLNLLSQDVHRTLESMVGMVGVRLSERFEKTNESMQSLTARLTAIDEAQKNIQLLSSDVVNLTRVVADKRARGVFGEIQLVHLVRDAMPQEHYEFDAKLPCGTTVPVLLKLPEPTGNIAVTTGLPLDSFSRIHEIEGDPDSARAAFRDDLKSAVDRAKGAIDPPFTSHGTVLFVPSEAAFAEIHAHHRSLVEETYRSNIWIVSPTTMMALLNMACSVIKDAATRKEAQRIRDELLKFGEDFKRFNRLVGNLAENIGQANKDVLKAQSEGQMITDRLAAFEHVAKVKMIETQQSKGEE